ncbi:YtxH-like protein [Noviherbaspirillum humi]|uniref:YtxH-like protein n=2 Tax=Noviherbaspirillum humi TaxID=1688639 RepID=A0A239HQ65_9BURK|nr:YtxH-like protein [Noviherbaspirillum humi]
MDRSNENTISAAAWLIGGLAAGAAIMFMADPERGPRRRAMVADKFNDAVAGASDYLDSAKSDMSSRVQDWTDTAQSKLNDAKSRLSDAGSRVADAGSRFADTGSSYSSEARSRLSDAADSLDSNSLQRALNRELWMIAGAAVGALTMFLADPDQGRRRRAMANDKLRSAANSVSSTSRDLGSRAQGLMASARSKVSGGGKYTNGQFPDGEIPYGHS